MHALSPAGAFARLTGEAVSPPRSPSRERAVANKRGIRLSPHTRTCPRQTRQQRFCLAVSPARPNVPALSQRKRLQKNKRSPQAPSFSAGTSPLKASPAFSPPNRGTCASETKRRSTRPSINPYESLGKGEGGVWGGGGKPFSRKVSLPFPNFSPHPIIPITAPVMQEARRPPMAARRPRERISCRRSGAMLPMPPSMIPTLPGLAKPQRA